MFSILEKDLYLKYSNPENQQKLTEKLLLKEKSGVKNNIKSVVFCQLISDYLNESEETPKKVFLQTYLKTPKVFKNDLFENLLISNKSKMINYCNEYFASDSTLVMKDFLESNFVIVIQILFIFPFVIFI